MDKRSKSIGIYLPSMTIGGAEEVAKNLCKGFINIGYDVDLVLVEKRGKLIEEIPKDVNIIDLGSGRVSTSIMPLYKYIITNKPDYFYSMMTESNVISSILSTVICNHTEIILSEHNMISHSIHSNKDRLIFHIAKAVYPLADHIVTVSEGVKQDLVKNLGISSEKCSTIYNPLDIGHIQQEAKKQPAHPI